MQTRLFRFLDKQLSAPYRQASILGRGDYESHPDLILHHFGEGERIHYAEPQHLQDLPQEFSNVIGTKSYPQPFVLEIKNGQIRGKHGLILTNDGQAVAESLLNHSPYLQTISAGRIHYPQRIPELWRQVTKTAQYETVFSLLNPFGNAYFHWMLESLPRIWLLKQQEAKLGETIPVLIEANPPKIVHETLQLLGVEKIIEWDVTLASAKHLFLPMALHGTGIPSGVALRWVAQELSKNLDLPAFNAPKIYISRSLAKKRRVVNEDEVLNYLIPLGFQSFELETMSLAEQVALFQQAEIVVAPHGAGLSNAIFSQKLKIVEFFEPSYLNACFMRLAGAMNFDYAFLFGESVGLDIRLELDLLKQIVH